MFVTAICKACVDLIVPVSDAELSSLGLTKGHGLRASPDDAQRLFDSYIQRGKIFPGGVGANSMAAAAQHGRAAYIGKVGKDANGELFAEDFRMRGIEFREPFHASKPTAHVIIFVTPDGERTMVIPTDAGAAHDLTSQDIEASASILANTSVLFIGLTWRVDACTDVISQAIGLAYEAKIATTLQGFAERNLSMDCVRRLASADIIFGNEAEFRPFLKRLGFENLTDAGRANPHKIYASTRGSHGITVVAGHLLLERPARPVRVKDLTGAGDAWAGAFMYALGRGYRLVDCIGCGNDTAAEVVGTRGARLQPRPAGVLRPAGLL